MARRNAAEEIRRLAQENRSLIQQAADRINHPERARLVANQPESINDMLTQAIRCDDAIEALADK